jgi:hypothetical protein
MKLRKKGTCTEWTFKKKYVSNDEGDEKQVKPKKANTMSLPTKKITKKQFLPS